MFNQISTYQQAEKTGEKSTQLAKFNADFERYLDDKGISGSDIITLANKISDYNGKQGTINESAKSVDYSIKMTLEINMVAENGSSFKIRYGYSDNSGVFKDNIYRINSSGGNLKTIIDNYNPIFNGKNKKLITLLTDVYNRALGPTSTTNIKNVGEILIEKKGSTYRNWDGSENWRGNQNPSMEQIKDYKEYTEFRTSTFVFDTSRDNPVYADNGQIQALYFRFLK